MLWRVAQAKELLKLGIRMDDGWHVMINEDGSSPQPRSVTRAVSKFLKKWGVTLHKLRHSHASHMPASNVHPKIVRERLGHSSISVTMEQSEAAATVDGVTRAAINKRDGVG